MPSDCWRNYSQECAKTHFKHDWEIKAQDIKDASKEGYEIGKQEGFEMSKAEGRLV